MGRTIISVHVTPRAGRDEIVGWGDGALLVRLRAPPVDGQANEALRRFLAKRLRIAASAVEIASGTSSRHKRVVIEGISEDEVRSRFG